MNHLHRAKRRWRERGPASSCPRCYIQQCGPLPEPVNGCLAFYSAQKQSSWSGQHSKTTTLHWTHSYFTSAVTRWAGCMRGGERERYQERQTEGDQCVNVNICLRWKMEEKLIGGLISVFVKRGKRWWLASEWVCAAEWSKWDRDGSVVVSWGRQRDLLSGVQVLHFKHLRWKLSVT